MPAPGEIVERIKQPAGEILLRYPKPNDAPALLRYINTVSAEQTYILFQGEQLTLEQEEVWLSDRLREIAAGNGIYVMAERDGVVIGSAGIHRKPLAEQHVAIFGITVAKEWRGKGIGTALMRRGIAEAKASMPGLRIIELSVFANNPRAQTLYAKEGFVQFGRLPGGIRMRGEYIDSVLMYLPVGN